MLGGIVRNIEVAYSGLHIIVTSPHHSTELSIMSVIGDLLFFTGMQGPSLDDVFRSQKAKVLPNLIAKVTAKRIAESGLDDVVESIVNELLIEKLSLDSASGISKIDEILISGVNNWGERYSAPGLRIAKLYPYTGDSNLWKLHAGSYSLNPPRGQVDSKALTLGMEVRANDQQSAINHIKSTLAEVLEYIEQQSNPIDVYNQSLPTDVRAALVERQAAIQNIDSIRNALDDI